MNRSRFTALTMALALALGSTACSEAAEEARQTASEATQTIAEATAETGAVSEAIAEARKDLHAGNLPLSGGDGIPKAELTPQGDLLINGVAVPMTATQREAALAYRTEILAVADAGMVMGEKGAGIAGDALALAATGLFGGDTSAGEARIEAKGKAMEAEALALCRRVVSLETAQNRLVELLPAFKPYAGDMNVEGDCNEASTTEDADQQADDATIVPAATLST